MAEPETTFSRKREPLMTAPNLVSFSRIPMGALVWLRPLDPAYVLSLMALAAASDVFDGWLERYLRAPHAGRRSGRPSSGVWIDPLCDKIFILSALAAVIVARKPALFMLPLIASREIIQTVAALAWELVPGLRDHLAFRFQATVLGKAATTGQFFTIGAVQMGHPAAVPLAVITCILGITAGTNYVLRAWRRRAS